MMDAVFSYLTGSIWLVLISTYAIRVRTYGRFQSKRVQLVGGGTVMVGEDIMQATYWAIDPVVRALVALGVTANLVTFSALTLGVAAAIALASGWFGLACLLATISTIGDILDGQVARVTKTGSAVGGLVDAIVDRYTEFAFVAAFILFVHESFVQVALALGALLACFMVSYTSSRADALGVSPPRGLMRRHERATYLILGAGLTPLLGPSIAERWPSVPPTLPFLVGLGIVGVVGNVAAIRRLAQIARALRLASR